MDTNTDFRVLKTRKLEVKEARKILKDFIDVRDDLEDFQMVQLEEIINNMDSENYK